MGDHDPGTEGTIFPNLTSSQDVFTYAKLFALFVIIVTGVVQLCRGKVKIAEKELLSKPPQNENFTFDETEPDVTKVALSFYSGEMFPQKTT